MINFDRKQNYFGLRDHLDRFVEIIWKVINIAAKFSKRNCSRNGKLIRGFPAVPQAGRGEEEGLKLYQLCPQDEHHRHGGAGNTQVREQVYSTVKTGLVLFRHRRRSRRSTRNGSGGTSKTRSKSLSPLQNGQKLQFNVSKGGIFLVKRKKTFCETIMSSGWLMMQ